MARTSRGGRATRPVRMPATAAAQSAAAAARAPRRRTPRASENATVTSGSAWKAASTGPARKRKLDRGSRQKRASQTAAKTEYTTASPSDAFPRGRTGTASASARPAVGLRRAAIATRAPRRNGQPAGKKGTSHAVAPAKSAERPAWPARSASVDRDVTARGRSPTSLQATRRRAAASFALGRRDGSGSSIRSTVAVSARGRSGRSDARGGAPSWTRLAVSSGENDENGCRPASDSQRRTPTDQTSAAPFASRPARRSGAM